MIDFRNPTNNRFLAVRELKIQGVRVPHYNRRADLVCFVNGLPLVFIELKAVYKNIRAGFDDNLTDYLDEHIIAHAFHHNAFLVVSNGDRARYGSITSKWEHFVEWKRHDENDKAAWTPKCCSTACWRRTGCSISSRTSSCSTTAGPAARERSSRAIIRCSASTTRSPRSCGRRNLKREFPPEKRLIEYTRPESGSRREAVAPGDTADDEGMAASAWTRTRRPSAACERAHPDLGRLGVFWHTQGSGKSYSMAFFAEKVRRVVRATSRSC